MILFVFNPLIDGFVFKYSAFCINSGGFLTLALLLGLCPFQKPGDNFLVVKDILFTFTSLLDIAIFARYYQIFMGDVHPKFLLVYVRVVADLG